MATTDKTTLKQWFLRGAKPLAAQFAAWIDSYWHKDELIPPGQIEGLQEAFDHKAEKEVLEIVAQNVGTLQQQLAYETEARREEDTAMAEALTAHEGNETVHLTEEERSAWNAKENAANKAIAGGYASLDSNAKVPLSQINDSLLGNVNYQGLWNAAANTPDLTVVQAKGSYYVVNAIGSRFGIDFATGDWIISNGTTWDKVDNTDAVTSVAGRTGNVMLTKQDVGLSNVDNTADKDKPVSSATQTVLNTKVNITDSRLSDTRPANGGNAATVGGFTPAQLQGFILPTSKSDLTFSQAELDENDKFILTASSGLSFTLNGIPVLGKQYLFVIKNISTGSINIERPSTVNDSMNSSSVTIGAGKEKEVSMWYDGNKRRWLYSEEM